MEIKPIGYVKNTAEENADFDELISEIVILPEYADGLFRIEECDELEIIFYFHKSEFYKLRVHPHRDATLPEVGVFSSRSPNRPNFLGLTRVKLINRKGSVITVKGLDAFNGTPVIDIKPAMRRDQQ